MYLAVFIVLAYITVCAQCYSEPILDANICEQRHVCDHICINTPDSFKCACKDGSQLKEDGRGCGPIMPTDGDPENMYGKNKKLGQDYGYIDQEYYTTVIPTYKTDVDECEQPNVCDHLCINTPGSYKCACKDGFELKEDRRDCRPIMPTEIEKESCPADQNFKSCIPAFYMFGCSGKITRHIRTMACKPGCLCKNRRHILHDGKCINKNLCRKYMKKHGKKDKQQRRCPTGQVYNKCGKPCPATCSKKSIGLRCMVKKCTSRCECQKGYVMHAGKCIKRSQCPDKPVKQENKVCPTGQKFVKCAYIRTCDYPSGWNKRSHCKNGCICLGKNVMHDGKCVPYAQCKKHRNNYATTKNCPADQVYNKCGSACNATCDNLAPICSRQCVARCECEKGKVLFNDKCLPQQMCTMLKGNNQAKFEANECGGCGEDRKVSTQDACYHNGLKTRPYCCEGFRFQRIRKQPVCQKDTKSHTAYMF